MARFKVLSVILSLLILVAMLLGCISPTAVPTPTPSPQPTPTPAPTATPTPNLSLSYESSAYGVRIKYPQDWTKQEGVKGTVVTFVATKESVSATQESLAITVQDLPSSSIPLSAYTQLIISRLGQTITDFNLIESGATTLAGSSAHKVVYTGKQGQHNIEILRIWTIINKQAYMITYVAESNRYFDFFGIIQQMIDSFSTSTPTSTPTPSEAPLPPGATQESILGIHTTKAIGEQKVIVIIADFPDVKPTLSQEQIYNKVFVELDKYFRDASYGQMWLRGNITKRYLLPQPVSLYKVSPYNLMIDRTVVRSLVQSVIDAADGDVDFSQYSHVIIVLGASRMTAPWGGMIPGQIGTTTISTKSGQTISSAAMLCEDSHLGSFVHDSIHALGGYIPRGKTGYQRIVPCLYDQVLQSITGDFRGHQFFLTYMGAWDPMSCHVYKWQLPPTGLSSWTKMRLGWIEPSKVAVINLGQTTTVRLDPLGSATSSTLVVKIPLTADTFYLVENRQKVGFDEYAPSMGVLVLYCDDSYVGECMDGKGPVQLMDANPSVPYLQGAAFDIGKREIFKDTKNNLAIILLRKVGLSYEIKITTADKADTIP